MLFLVLLSHRVHWVLCLVDSYMFFNYLSSFHNVVIICSTCGTLGFISVYRKGIFGDIGEITLYRIDIKYSVRILSSFRKIDLEGLNLACIYLIALSLPALMLRYFRSGVKAIGGVRGHFCMWRLDESSNCRGVNTFYGMKISCRTRKILQFEFSGLHTFL